MKGRVWEHMDELGPRIQAAQGLGLFLDFDGTLTPLVDDPDGVQLAENARRLLGSMASQPDLVLAVVSGRSLADIEARIGLAGIYYAGNHGLEIRGPGCKFVEPTSPKHQATLTELAKSLSARLRPIEGARVENKGLTASVHFRRVPEPQWEEVRRIVHAALANCNHPFQLTPGDKVFDIRPRVRWTKGDAVNLIRAKAPPTSLAVYLGDDATDEDAFAELTQDDITIKVGEAAETQAQYRIEGPDQVLEFLFWLAKQRVHDPTPLILQAP